MSGSAVFVVRIGTGQPFWATARAVDREETATFSEPAALLRFLVSDAASKTVDTDRERRSPSARARCVRTKGDHTP